MDEALEIHIREVVGEILMIAKAPNSEIVVEDTEDRKWCRLRVLQPPLGQQGGVRPTYSFLINIAIARQLVDNPEAERQTYAAMIREALTTIQAQLEHQYRGG
jgi:hypothetical protein